MKVYRLCEYCNKEFVLSFEQSPVGIGSIIAQQLCPHCNKTNNLWIRITSEGDSQSNKEASTPGAGVEVNGA